MTGMGSHDEKREDRKSKYRDIVGGLASLSISMVGGVMLYWWAQKYHPRNRQLWMVPFGLILLATPVVVLFSVFVSDLRNPANSSRRFTHPLSAESDIEKDDAMTSMHVIRP
ncbi:hypothetical protein NMG60_11022662 [Bertholletia excelsa]